MKISKRQLRRIIKEEAADCLKDYRLGGMTYQEYKDCLKRFDDIESQGGGYGGGGSRYPRYRRKTSYVGVEANQEQIAAVENALAAKPNNFLSSILTQLQGGRGLSGKQKSIVKRIVSKHDPGAASLFENKARITRKQLRRIIKEAQSLEGYSQEAIDAAKYAVGVVPYPQGGLIENEIHLYLENTVGLDRRSDEIFTIADEALSVAGIMLDVGPDAL